MRATPSHFRFLLALLGFVPGVLFVPSPAVSAPPRSWGPGERIDYVIKWIGVPAGDSIMEVAEVPTPEGPTLWRVSSVTTSRSLVDLLYKVRNRYETWVDPGTGLTAKYIVKQNEGGKKKEFAQIFDQAGHTVTRITKEKGKTESRLYEVPPEVQDTLSALYATRDASFAVGDTLSFKVFEGRKNWDMTVEVLAREKVTVPAGTFDAFKLHPIVQNDGIFQKKGDLHVWMTDDERRIPVLMRSEVRVGTIAAEMTAYRAGTTVRVPEVTPSPPPAPLGERREGGRTSP